MSAQGNPLLCGLPQPSLITTSSNTAVVLTNGMNLFTVVGDIIIQDLVLECITANNTTASTVQFSYSATVGGVATFSGTSASLASLAAGATVDLTPTALATAPAVTTNGVAPLGLGNGIRVPDGTITLTVNVGSTTGTWQAYLTWTPLNVNSTVTPAF